MQKRAATPKSEMEDFESKTFLVTTMYGAGSADVVLEEVPELEGVEEKDFPEAFAKKCKECCKICNFWSEDKDAAAKATKKAYLEDFEKVFSKPRFMRVIGNEEIKAFLHMCKVNLGRSYASLKIISSIECPDNVLDVSWPHLEAVYKALKALFLSKLASKVSDSRLLTILISNSFSCDERERIAVKECLSFFYGKVAEDKPKMIMAAFDQIRLGNVSAELLGFIYDVVPDIGTTFPDKKEALFREVMRLHNSPLFMKFSTSLTQCMVRFIRDDNTRLNALLKYLSTHWPTYGIKKQVKLTEELETLMENFSEAPIDKDASELLFKQLAFNYNECAVDTAEAAMSFTIGAGHEDNLVKYIAMAMTELVPKLNTARKEHWNGFIRDDARIILDLLSKASPKLFSEEVKVIKGLKKAMRAKEAKRLEAWQLIMKTAKKNWPKIRLSQIALRVESR